MEIDVVSFNSRLDNNSRSPASYATAILFHGGSNGSPSGWWDNAGSLPNRGTQPLGLNNILNNGRYQEYHELQC